MFRFTIPVILIGIAIAGFFAFINPLYRDILVLRTQVASYDEALNNSKALENERDKLTSKYNTIDPANLERLSKLLPNNVDNIRLILEIEKVAGPYGMVLKDVKYNTVDTGTAEETGGITQGNEVSQVLNKDYGAWDLEFSTEGTYNNFISFIKDLESNLRIVDTSSIGFSSSTGSVSGSSASDIYRYAFKIKTYWLKN